MYHTIIVAMALDHNISPEMLALARYLRAEGGRLLALHVIDAPTGIAVATQTEEGRSTAYTRAAALMTEKLAGQDDITPKLVEGHVARDILSVAESEGADLIIMGSHAPGLSDYFLGSTAARVVRHAPCAVHVYRR
ncbi:MAG: universal stress protein [Shimia sp.]